MNCLSVKDRAIKLWLCIPIAAAMLLLAGCPQGTRIADLNRDPGRYQNKEVAISGNVVQSFGLLGEGAFEVDDGTGRIWVLSGNYGVPGKGTRVGVVGRFIGGATLGTRSFGTAIQQTRRPHY